MTTAARYHLSLPRLPSWRDVGGNVRHSSGWARTAAIEAERTAWTMLLNDAPRRPRLTGPVRLHVTLHLPTKQGPDFENAAVALKTLIDLLEPVKVANRGRRGAVKGLLGWLENDRQIVWPWQLFKVPQSPKAPLTELELEAL